MREQLKDSAEKRRLAKEWDESGVSGEPFASPRGRQPETGYGQLGVQRIFGEASAEAR